MIRALTSAGELAAAQDALRREFYDGATILSHGVGFPGGNVALDIAWHAEHGIWAYLDDESAWGPDGAGGRYWNAFGLEDPTTVHGSLSITVEINPPLQGVNPRVAGLLGRDPEGTIWLLHRGTIGGGRAGVGKDLFWRQFSGPTALAYDGLDMPTCAIVAPLGAGTLVPDLRRFADEVSRMKSSVRKRSTA